MRGMGALAWQEEGGAQGGEGMRGGAREGRVGHEGVGAREGRWGKRG